MKIGSAQTNTDFTPSSDQNATVQLGETDLSQVADRLGASLEALRLANPQVQSDKVQAGQALTLPSGQSGGPQLVPAQQNLPASAVATPSRPRTMEQSIDSMNMRSKLDSLDMSAPGGPLTLLEKLKNTRNLADSGGVVPLDNPVRADGDSGSGSAHRPTADEVKFHGPGGGGDNDSSSKAGTNKADVSHYNPAPANVHYRKDTGPTAGPHASGIPDEGAPKATNLKDKAIDAAMDKIYKKVSGGLKAQVSVDRHPQLSSEQEALVDFSTGVGQYKQYMEYAKTALELLKLSPNNEQLKQRLTQVFGNLEKLGAHLDKVSSVLGKAQKYAGMVKDAIGITQSCGKLVDRFQKMDFNDPKSVKAFADAFSDANAQGQSVLEGARDSLIEAGLKGGMDAAKGGLVLGALSFYLDMADQGLQAGLKNVNAYIDRQKGIMDQIEKGGVAPKQPEIPTLPPPPDLQTYGGQQFQDRLDKMGQVYQAVQNEFDNARNDIRSKAETKKQEIHDNFDRNEFPQIYKQYRGKIESDLKQQIHDLENNIGSEAQKHTPAENLEHARSLMGMLDRMEQHDRNGLSMDDLRSEVNELKVALGPRREINPRTGNEVVTTDPSNPFKGTPFEKTYNDALAKDYHKSGVDEEGVQNSFAQAGLTRQNERDMTEKLYKELHLMP